MEGATSCKYDSWLREQELFGTLEMYLQRDLLIVYCGTNLYSRTKSFSHTFPKKRQGKFNEFDKSIRPYKSLNKRCILLRKKMYVLMEIMFIVRPHLDPYTKNWTKEWEVFQFKETALVRHKYLPFGIGCGYLHENQERTEELSQQN